MEAVSDLPGEAKPVPGYDGDYALSPDGVVYSKKRGVWSEKTAWVEHGHRTVELYRFGERTRRRIAVLVEEVFGGPREEVPDDLPLLWYLRRQYSGLGEAGEFLQSFT